MKKAIVLTLLFFNGLCFGAEDVSRVHLLFAGDVMGHDTQIEAAYSEKDKAYDYISCFQYIL